MRGIVAIQRHALGPRVYVAGRRVHEWHVGAGLVAAARALALLHVVGTAEALAVGVVGVWLLAKDWRDIAGGGKDSAAWRLGLHRRPTPRRPLRRGDWLPPLAALAAAAIALVNLVSALTPNVEWRGRLLLQVEPMPLIPVFHTLAVPASAALLLASLYLRRRRHRAWQLAVVLLGSLALLNIAKGLDFEEAAASLAGLALLWWGRDAFHVRHAPLRLDAALRRCAGSAAALLGIALFSVWLTAPESASAATVLRETGDLITWQAGPLTFRDETGGLPFAVGLLGGAVLAAAAWTLFRPLAAPGSLPDRRLRHAAGQLVRRYGSDTLAYFKLRRDQHYLFSPGRGAFLGYRIENGVMLVAGDPVGSAEEVGDAIGAACAFAELHGLRLAAVGVGERMLPVWQEAGLRPLYVGDEAVVDAGTFSLEGRAVRKVRQSVARLERAGYATETRPVAGLSADELERLEAVSALWRAGASERGFSMALDALRNEDAGDATVILARDADGAVRGFLHFVPAYGRRASSLSFMRRDPDTPNGLTEFLVVRAIEALRAQGVDEVSLNFAAFARWLHEPRGRAERVLGRAVSLASRWFQIESLYRFNAKFFPRWEPRYLVYERLVDLPRVGLATLWVEGQLPKPSLRRRPAIASSAS